MPQHISPVMFGKKQNPFDMTSSIPLIVPVAVRLATLPNTVNRGDR
jgi:hypothetical protein